MATHRPSPAQRAKAAIARIRRRYTHRASRRPPEQPRPNPVRIAVLEHDLLGIPPQPGTAAALAIALRRVATCIEHQPVDVTALTDPAPNAVCSGCGQHLLHTDGQWRPAAIPASSTRTGDSR
ncbi:hypothetical protein [Kitasatospora sp. NPDC090091]|uniref:hypothetical protein n=1 Tax=Kitasatospora sp. NPDC090091 TaxID=3364081 RepID=UPI00382EEF41